MPKPKAKKKAKKKKANPNAFKRPLNDSDEMSSIIASDSSFEHHLELLDDERPDRERVKKAEERFLANKLANQ